MGEGRLIELFASCRAENRAALLPYLTAGLPTPAESVGLFAAMAAAGADGFEVGLPYADPLMDGPIIQTAGDRALRAGSGVAVGIDIAGNVVAATGKPVVVMTYVNPVLRIGIDDFASRLGAAGCSGAIIADLPVDEAEPFAQAFRARDLGLVLFAAPTTTDARLDRIVGAKPAFIYGVAEIGVTGERSAVSAHAARLVERIRDRSDLPVVLGVGISTPMHAAAAAAVADGVIVGSALVRRALEAESGSAAAEQLGAAVAELAPAMWRSR